MYPYRIVKKFERKWGPKIGFNRRALGLENLLAWAEDLGGIPLEDHTVPSTAFFLYRRRPFILYNPDQHPLNLVLSLGHEVGHLLFRHHETMFFRPHRANLWARNGDEKDAGVVGFLCWLPTRELRKLLRNPELEHPEALARELATCDSEWPFLVKACEARLRIWRGLQRIVKEVPK